MASVCLSRRGSGRGLCLGQERVPAPGEASQVKSQDKTGSGEIKKSQSSECSELELELILSQMAKKPVLRGKVGARVERAWADGGKRRSTELELELILSQMPQKQVLRG